jgi:hypothetical protein
MGRPGQGFAECGEVRRDTEMLLRAAGSHAEAGDDFVEDQERARACA